MGSGPPGPGPEIALVSVAATSARNAWAIGSSASGGISRTLIEHWNGRNWRAMPSPDVGGATTSNNLAGVYASSAGNAWVVGSFGSPAQVLAFRWS